ncbi:MAG: nucleotidyltransferase domain-containing protein [Bacteroidota bacterium]
MVNVIDINIQKSIKKYLSVISKQYRIEKAFLYGSHASGKADEDSDIDLAIVSPSFTGNRFVDNVELGRLTWGIDTRIEPIAFTPDDFNELFFAQEIKKRGIEITFN